MKNYHLDNQDISIVNEHTIRSFFSFIYQEYGLELTPEKHFRNYSLCKMFTKDQQDTLNNILKDCDVYCNIYGININNLAADVVGTACLSKAVFADLLLQQYLS